MSAKAAFIIALGSIASLVAAPALAQSEDGTHYFSGDFSDSRIPSYNNIDARALSPYGHPEDGIYDDKYSHCIYGGKEEYDKAMAYFNQQAYDMAEIGFSCYLHRDLFSAEAWYRLGLIHQAKGRYGNARMYLYKAIHNGYSEYAPARLALGMANLQAGNTGFAKYHLRWFDRKLSSCGGTCENAQTLREGRDALSYAIASRAG